MEHKEYRSFLKTVTGNEGNKCNYPTRLDTYGCGCAHDCKYCYAKSLLNFRKLWNPNNPSVADIEKIRKPANVKQLCDKVVPISALVLTPDIGHVLQYGGQIHLFVRTGD